jgi:pilus assembly protein CpaB
MPQNRSLIVLGLAILLGLAAVFIANSYLSGVEQQAETVDNTMVRVAVARVPLEYGTAVTTENIRFVIWPRSSLPAGTFPSTKGLVVPGAPRVALRSIEVNEPIMQSKLSGEGGRASISAVLPADKRAVAVRVGDVSGVAGFVLPGDSVDVFITRQVTDGAGDQTSQITDVLLQNVKVIAIDQNANDNANEPKVSKTATLEVDTVDAQKLVLGETVGSLSLALRNVANQDTEAVQTVSIDDLQDGAYSGRYRSTSSSYANYSPAPVYRGGSRSRTPARPKRPSNTTNVEIVRGTGSTNYEVKRHAGF